MQTRFLTNTGVEITVDNSVAGCVRVYWLKGGLKHTVSRSSEDLALRGAMRKLKAKHATAIDPKTNTPIQANGLGFGNR